MLLWRCSLFVIAASLYSLLSPPSYHYLVDWSHLRAEVTLGVLLSVGIVAIRSLFTACLLRRGRGRSRCLEKLIVDETVLVFVQLVELEAQRVRKYSSPEEGTQL